MTNDDTPPDRDRVIGEPETPLPEPWFIRDLRTRRVEAPSAATEPVPARILPEIEPEPRSTGGAANFAAPPGKPWYLSPFFFGGLAVAVVMLIALFSGERVDGPTGGAVVPPVDGARSNAEVASAPPVASVPPVESSTGITSDAPPVASPEYEPLAPEAPRVTVAPRELDPQPEPERVPVAARDFNPSFDCDRVTSRVNQMICASPDLAALDRRMSRRFDQVAASLDPDARDELEDSRVRFLQRKQSCDDEACIARVYEDRIDEIASYDEQSGDR